jgi:hypothetical protein
MRVGGGHGSKLSIPRDTVVDIPGYGLNKVNAAFAFGGAAPLHAARLARKLGMKQVIVPVGAGVGSAFGFLRASIAYEVVRTRHMRLDMFDAKMLNELFAAMRAEWPGQKPMAVRISASDWVGEAGVTGAEAVEIAAMFAAAGADIIDVSAGQTSPDAKPIYGRMFQTPFSDRIRNEAGLATMAVGNITEAEQVNQILLAGRADLVCLARPHLADPYWTLHQAIKVGDPTPWPLPYLAGRDQAMRLLSKSVEVARV